MAAVPTSRHIVAGRIGSGYARVVPGDAILHPMALVAIGVLLINDHILKGAWPGWWTGKLSDVAGLIFFPILLQGFWEIGTARRGRFSPRFTVLLVAVGASALAFSAIEVWPPAADIAAHAGGIGQWPARALVATAGGSALPGVSAVALTADVTDLIALAALAIPLILGWRRTGSRPSIAVTAHAFS